MMNPDLLKFIGKIEKIVKKMEYGTLSCNVIVTKGQPNMKTLYIVRSKRKRFPPNKNGLTQEE